MSRFETLQGESRSTIVGLLNIRGIVITEKSFALPIYVDAMARASLKSEPTCAPRHGHGIDPRVLNYFDIDAAVDTSFPSDCSDSRCSSKSGDIYEHYSDGSMSS